MKYLTWLTATTTVLLTAIPSFAQSQITAVDLETDKQNLELKLEIDNNDLKSSFVFLDRGKTLEATILNTELSLSKAKSFQQKNPLPGIEKITLKQIDSEHTQISLIKDENLEITPILKQENSAIIVSFNKNEANNSFIENIVGFKDNVVSLLKNNKSKDSKKEDIKIKNNKKNDDVLVPNPEIIITNQSDEFNNGLPAENPYEQPYLPRAVAPPVGDMAVSNINALPDTVDLGSSAVVPRLVLRDAPVREVLSLLARQVGLNVVFSSNGDGSEDGEDTVEGPTVSLDLENQSVQEVFDSILLISALDASRRGNIIYIGEKLPAQARNLISRTIRINQAPVEEVASFLSNLGAEYAGFTQPKETEIYTSFDGYAESGSSGDRQTEFSGGSASQSSVKTETEEIIVNSYFKGLAVAVDTRLNALTLIGEPRKVEMATAYIIQMDARRRQVAVNVKVIDVNLLNQDFFNSSFSFGINDTFYSQNNGAATINLGDTRPPTSSQINSSQFSPAVVPFNVPGAELSPFFDIQESPYGGFSRGINEFTNRSAPYARPNFGTLDNPFQPGISDIDIDDDGAIEYEYSLPGLFQFPKRFLAQLEARITSGNAKILTDPTLVVQEGEAAVVRLTQEVITSVNTQIDAESGTRTITPVIGEAGLQLGITIEQIDDNGFVSLVVAPEISSIGATQEFDSGSGAVNLLNLLNTRFVSSGLIRVRDGQTLILSGIIQDQERASVSKVPILGDIPLLGSLFRSTEKSNERAEVVILLTPEVIDEQADFGYNYQPGKETREMLQNGGMNLPNQPQ